MMKEAFPAIVDVNFTANLEALLDGVEEGNVKWKSVVSNFYPDLAEAVEIAEKELEQVQIADEVVAIIAGLAATEVDGVTSMAGNVTNELVSRLGMKNLSKGIQVEVLDNEVKVDVAINIAYGYNIPDISAKVQERIKTTIENMTGLTVSDVNVRIASVEIDKVH